LSLLQQIISSVGHEHGRGGVLPSFTRLLLQLVWLSFTLFPFTPIYTFSH
jgi:hypothetical protein